MPRIEILSHKDDGRAHQIEQALERKGLTASVRVLDVYMSEHAKADSAEFIGSLTNPITQKAGELPEDFDWALEIGYLPGVTDNVGHTATELLELAGAKNDNECYSAQLYLIKGELHKDDIETLSQELSNKLIQRATIKSRAEFDSDGGMETIIPKVTLDNKGSAADEIDLDLSDEELAALGSAGITDPDGTSRGPLGLSLNYIKSIKEHFDSVEKRKPTDIELETLAQTWSEHCKHTIFASPIDEIKDGIYKHYIKRVTREIRKKRGKSDICVSVFSDNSGGIIFDEDWLITDKVETHNSPSALDPFGGSITGIVGVNRDCVGFGMGAKPVMNRYGFCLADPRKNLEYYRDKAKTNPILSPETIMNGVVRGVEVGGNCSGIPTPQGFAYFDDRYVGKPLVFVGTIGLIPREINGRPGHEKCAQPGDKIVMVGGRVGRDGIHGATFSSVALDEGSPATAVQIGDPITQKKFSDAIIKEIRDKDWYSAITDNGAGGLSSSVGEMGEQSGGFTLELETVPLKYPGMAPWEIWISESQERMTLAVPPENTEKLIAFLARRGAEATVVGEFTDTGRAHITYSGNTVMNISMDFLHDGLPETPLSTSYTPAKPSEPELKQPEDYGAELRNLLGQLNICSKEFITTQYDHEVQAGSVLKPLQGPGRVYGDASVTKPVLNSPKGVVLSQGLAPRYSDIDTGPMASYAVDMAVRQAVAAGVDYNHLALLDNFCWCSSDEPERLGQLKRAAEFMAETAITYETPFISGKDSMFNDFKGYDKDGQPVKISVPPTLLISSIGVIPDISQSISIAPKQPGDLVYLLGTTKNELGGSEYYAMHGVEGGQLSTINAKDNDALYQAYSAAARQKLIASAISPGLGGLAVALAKMAIAGQMGMDINLPEQDLPLDAALFSETGGRFIVTIAPEKKEAFESALSDFTHIGEISNSNKLNINSTLEIEIKNLDELYKQPLKNY